MKKILPWFFILILIVFANGCALLRTVFPGEDTIYAAFGDCMAAGSIATPISNSFASLTAAYLNKVYPRTYLINCGVFGTSTASYLGYLRTFLVKIAQSNHGRLARATLTMGLSDLTTTSGCTYCGFTEADDVTISYKYKSQMQAFITEILKSNPSCKLVLCTIPDPNNGGMGTGGGLQLGKFFKPAGLLQEFNKRIWELSASNKLPVADFYTAMMGHPEYWVVADFHPNNAGHAVMASVIEAQFDPNAARVISINKAIYNATHTATVSFTNTPTNTPTSTATNAATASLTNTSTPALIHATKTPILDQPK